jgi:hypothetical protein
MSKHLKIIKERTQNISPQVDLRGLGNEKVFKHFYPKAILTEKHSTPHSHEFLKDCEKLNIQIETSDNKNLSHLFCNSKTLTHKEQALSLFLLALKHSEHFHSKETSRFFLWEAPIFRHLLQTAMNGHPEKDIPTAHEFWSSMHVKHKHYMWLDAATAMHLKQADIDVSSADEGTGLSLEQCHSIYVAEKKKLQTHHEHEMNSKLKAGAK